MSTTILNGNGPNKGFIIHKQPELKGKVKKKKTTSIVEDSNIQ